MDLKDIAVRLMLTGDIAEKDILKCYDYRKNKSIKDIVKAQMKAKKNGMYKIEFEIDMCELYLKDVLKIKR
jgi:hypothetical protein